MYQHSALSENCCNRCFKYCRAFLTSLFFHFSQKNSWQASLHSAPRFPTQSGWVRNHLCDSGDSCGMKWRVPSSSLLCRWLSSPQCVYDMARDPGYLGYILQQNLPAKDLNAYARAPATKEASLPRAELVGGFKRVHILFYLRGSQLTNVLLRVETANQTD